MPKNRVFMRNRHMLAMLRKSVGIDDTGDFERLPRIHDRLDAFEHPKVIDAEEALAGGEALSDPLVGPDVVVPEELIALCLGAGLAKFLPEMLRHFAPAP